MSSMVERMARAMKPTTARLADSLVRAGADRNEAAKLLPLDEALAALRELREPTEVMADAAYHEANVGYSTDPLNFADQFTAAIDAEIAAYEGKK